MRFAYGQIIKNWLFVRKFDWNLGLLTDKQLQNSTLSVIPSRRTEWACAAFGKIIAVYGQINENGGFVRKWLDRKMAITDKIIKNWRFVRKSGWNSGWIGWTALHLKKAGQSQSHSARFFAQKNQHPHVADTGQKLIRFRFPASDQEDQAKRNDRFDDDHESAPCNLCSSEPDV